MCCAGAAVCCASQAICNCLCLPCKKAGVANRNFAKIGYTFFQAFFMLSALTLMFFSGKLQDKMPSQMTIC